MELADEHPHAPGANPAWKENWYVNVMDVENAVYGMCHLSFYPNQRRGSALAALNIEGRKHMYFNMQRLDGPVDAITDGTLTWRNVEPGKVVRVTLDAPAAALDLTFTGRFPIYDYRDATGGGLFSDPLGIDECAFDHYEQSCTADGSVEVRSGPQKGLQKKVTGLSQRDHTWGVREEPHVNWHWGAAQFADRAINYFRITHGDRIALGGFLSRADGNHALTAMTVEDFPATQDSGAFPSGSRLKLTFASGESCVVATEELAGFQLRGGPGGFGLQELFVTFRDEDTGDAGVGLAEYVLGGKAP